MTGCYLDANDAELACSRSEPEPGKVLRFKFFAMKRCSLSMFQSLFTKEPEVTKGPRPCCLLEIGMHCPLVCWLYCPPYLYSDDMYAKIITL